MTPAATGAARLPQRPVDRHPPLVYGPVSSRRFGRSLGVNLMPSGLKLCSFDCLYCQCGPTMSRRRLASDPPFPTLDEIEQALGAALEADPDVRDVCFAGDGEPTMHPRFREAVVIARRLRDRWAPDASITVLSNGSHVGKPEVRAALALTDRPVLKLDAAVEPLWRALDGPARGLTVERLIETFAGLMNIRTQTMLVRGVVANATPDALDALAGALRRIRPVEAQIMTVTRAPAHEGLVPLSTVELISAAEYLRSAAPGVPVAIY